MFRLFQGKDRQKHTLKHVLSGGIASLVGISLLFIPSAAGSANSRTCDSGNGVRITDATVCKGLAFYQGKTLIFLGPTTAGTNSDIESRIYVKEVGAYLGATIDVENVPGSNLSGQDALAAAKPDGLTIGYYAPSSDFYDTITNAPSVNFNLKYVTLIGGPPAGLSVVVSNPSSPYVSFAALRKLDTKTAPVKITMTPGGAALEAILLMRAFGLPATYLSAYVNSSAVLTGFLRGDGPLDAQSVGTLSSPIEQGAARLLVLMEPSAKLSPSTAGYSIWRKYPTSGALLAKYPPTTNGERAAAKYSTAVDNFLPILFGGPSGIPSQLSATLDAAFAYATKTASVKSQLTALNDSVGLIGPTQEKAILVHDLPILPKISSFLGY